MRNRATSLRRTVTVCALLSVAGAASIAASAPEPAAPGHPGMDPAQIAAAMAAAQNGQGKDKEFPPFDEVVEGLDKVVSTADGEAPLYELYADKETGRLLAVLPPNYEHRSIMLACTVSGGDPQAGVMGPTHYAKWRRIGKDQLALVAPNYFARTDGDRQAKDSVAQLYTGSVIVSTPIMTMSPKGGPVIDLGSLATAQAGSFFGSSEFGQYGPNVRMINAKLATLTKAKAFPENVIVEYEAPNETGRLIRLTYSIGSLAGTPGYTPRKADPRVGYFYNWAQDFARPATADVTDRFITRWSLEKADPSLSMSPPKQPIVWHIEHTTPVKFRRWVREGILLWNEAFEGVGIVGALEVYQQDALTGAHMDKDPEDARYNFFRWNASDQGYAIGPSRTNPETGEILDADVVWHQGLTRAVRGMLENLSDTLVEQSFSPETLAFFDEHPGWDPRVRLAPPARQEQMLRQRAMRASEALDIGLAEPDHPWTGASSDPTNSACRIGDMLSMNISLVEAAVAANLLDTGTGGDSLDGLPEEFLGPMIRYISAHEVGHCLGLQHNMAASTVRTLEEINSPGFDGCTIGSVMDYVAPNINHDLGEAQGPYATPCVGPYDKWAIAFGYGPDDKVGEVLARVGEPDNIFLSQIAMAVGGDPRNMTWDMGSDNLRFAESRLGLVRDLRSRLVSDIVADGESWAVARRRFSALLSTHVQSLFIASRWIGGSYTNNDFKGDPGGRAPVEDVPADKQRRALEIVMANGFEDGAFGLTPDLVRHMGKEYWWDPAGFNELIQDPSFTVHDMVGGVQATSLSLVLNPTTLRRVYDNEFRADAQADTLTLSEVVNSVTGNVWRECRDAKRSGFSASNPMVSSFRRNLQREHVGRLVDLALLPNTPSPALRTISSLATQELREIDALAAEAERQSPDPYTAAHLADVRTRIAKALEAAYVLPRG